MFVAMVKEGIRTDLCFIFKPINLFREIYKKPNLQFLLKNNTYTVNTVFNELSNKLGSNIPLFFYFFL